MDLTPRPGWLNMAADRELLRRAQRENVGTLRLYRWEPHCLSFGRHEPARRRYDRARIEALGVDVVRRPTGGRAVWHARELTYAVAAPVEWLGSLPDAYRAIHGMVAQALRRLGAEATLAAPGGTAPLDAGACFAQPVGGEVLVGGRKVVGSAQLREGGALLQHGSILLEDDQSLVRRVTVGSAPAGAEAPLAALLGRPVDLDRLAGALAAEAERLGGTWTAVDPGPLLAAAGRAGADFRSEGWTWAR